MSVTSAYEPGAIAAGTVRRTRLWSPFRPPTLLPVWPVVTVVSAQPDCWLSVAGVVVG
ncbi:hypothetical protein V2I01_10670 [Micromonospora sp. BRA006-A]|nr:hypothetical protein [Micromonospora sp. BRA006-A]